MTKLILKFVLITMCLLCNLVTAQDFSGQATYESKTQMNDFKITGNDMTEDMKKKMEENMKKAFEKTYILNFNKFESVYSEEVKLEAPKPNSGMSFKTFSSGDGKKYKNVKDKIEISEEDFLAKSF